MEKRIKQIPIIEEVQTGIQELEVYVTSDEHEFVNEHQANEHEFRLSIKEKEIRNIPYHATLFYIENEEQVNKWLARWDENYTQVTFDPSELQHPNWFVIYVDDEDLDDYMTVYSIKTLDDYKKFLSEQLDKLTK
jgi:hypothetical protein